MLQGTEGNLMDDGILLWMVTWNGAITMYASWATGRWIHYVLEKKTDEMKR